ncbi:MAG: hydrogen gas-evolving membrane-bound hydrogenase subunit E [Dehalococcoidia bacterium]
MRQIVGVILLLVLVAFLVWGVLNMRDFGYPPSDMDDYMIENAQVETGSNNVVAGVLLDYRGLDTLGEVSVLFTAVTGVLLLFRTLKGREEIP